MRIWAIEISEENVSAILSEGYPAVDLDYLTEWLETYGDGYFVIDGERAFKRSLFKPSVFEALYKFRYKDSDNLFREIERR